CALIRIGSYVLRNCWGDDGIGNSRHVVASYRARWSGVPPKSRVLAVCQDALPFCVASSRRGGHPKHQPAKVAELADAPDLGSGGVTPVGVRVPPFAQRLGFQDRLESHRITRVN